MSQSRVRRHNKRPVLRHACLIVEDKHILLSGQPGIPLDLSHVSPFQKKPFHHRGTPIHQMAPVFDIAPRNIGHKIKYETSPHRQTVLDSPLPRCYCSGRGNNKGRKDDNRVEFGPRARHSTHPPRTRCATITISHFPTEIISAMERPARGPDHSQRS
ncbi:hypothetical protein JTE90_026597 [Oedothorax gibbosus]|uniref:Uncharacterized protein n=1 Tax=Oedothorax gibbosus TaxID=931172 RepID=A0AAV6TDL4_9ARAC|nr:hypothetical protein JTE90_026597 [Oedothorax gibbosus]